MRGDVVVFCESERDSFAEAKESNSVESDTSSRLISSRIASQRRWTRAAAAAPRRGESRRSCWTRLCNSGSAIAAAEVRRSEIDSTWCGGDSISLCRLESLTLCRCRRLRCRRSAPSWSAIARSAARACCSAKSRRSCRTRVWSDRSMSGNSSTIVSSGLEKTDGSPCITSSSGSRSSLVVSDTGSGLAATCAAARWSSSSSSLRVSGL